jgi:hypothetical protein
MGDASHADRLMTRLLHAIELSLLAAEASRDAVQEILRQGAGTAGDAPAGALTAADREFLRLLGIHPDR